MKTSYFIATCCIIFLNSFGFSQNPYISQIISEVNLDSLMQRSNEISGEVPVIVDGVTDTIKSRHRLKPGNELAYRYIMQSFAAYGLQTDSLLFGTVGKNALAIQPGVVYPERYYIICGHYDGMPNAVVAPAADDDGSGTAAVLEAARVLSNYQFEHTIIYALWDEEEQGLLGANAYASLANTNNDTLLGVLNMDAIAWDSDNDDVARIHSKPIGNSEDLSDTIFSINTTYNIGLSLIANNPGATYSDHAAFWTNNFGAVLIIQDWDNDANPHYHTVTDKVMYFNQPYFHKIAKLTIASIAALAVPAMELNLNPAKQNNARIYPNPAQDFVTIQFGKPINDVMIRITDIHGSTVMTRSEINAEWISMNTSPFSAGVYFVRIQSPDYSTTLKLVKQ